MRCFLAAAVLVTSAMPVLAGPASDMAKNRIEAVAKGDLAAITSTYGDKTELHWIGGPLDGTYAGAEPLKTVWSKFVTAQGNQTAAIASLSEAANPKGATVSADVTFTGKNTVKVRYILVYRDGKLTDEIWQVNPNATY
ncbi:nuclear transport factor 2 family protein [Roseixanthobacter liquoris]|uniref:nuclear transport factor 2 family protein n=1 Tax=Roseixanthobacter liquoris TaxID=3119921 RepID=UPI003727E08E